MSDNKQFDEAGNIVRMILALVPSVVDEAAIRAALGDSAAKSLAEVARTFGVANSTVKHTWRAAGMPGNSKARNYPLADIVIWLLKRNLANEETRARGGVNGFAHNPEARRELQDIELEAARTDLRIRRAKAQKIEGQFVPLFAVQSVLRGILNVTRDAFMNLPRKWNPRFPMKHATAWTTELENDIRSILTIIADTDAETMLERCNGNDTRSV